MMQRLAIVFAVAVIIASAQSLQHFLFVFAQHLVVSCRPCKIFVLKDLSVQGVILATARLGGRKRVPSIWRGNVARRRKRT
jgi:hypothetical protein